MVKKAAFSFLSSNSIKDIFSIKVLSIEFTSLNTSSAVKSSATLTPRALAILTIEDRAISFAAVGNELNQSPIRHRRGFLRRSR
jgi:hypothetical protein